MKKRIILSGAIFIAFFALILAVNGLGRVFNLDLRVMLLLAALSVIVILFVVSAFVFGHGEKAGYVFLGSVVFKMFGIGYMAVFQKEFKNHVIGYFLIFWIYLVAEAAVTLIIVNKGDKNHKKHKPEVLNNRK